ncbi:PREDICTED: LOW QUALITY PROTEIN: mitochondrial amidoxime reducing component 2-like [Gekko japonicus]|uniref:LOW QUALITY PROTEIN: mitochondrial amidoxime reducing component 2-like n=1 Tax=Gekko japonicus TaxID=146911 RepID=A0ABM1L4G2_GEKJA|nr:PREDICTED: LOW QUALITY PROTEIN: mitochondrial amidoxime reducing component 2-like [Gekko japonicus]
MPMGPPGLSPSRVAWLCVAGATLALGVAAAWRRRRAHRSLVQVGTVSGLYIYPVKSCRRVSVEDAEATELGLRKGDLRDRFWLVIKEDGHMVTARQEPRLVLVSVAFEKGRLILPTAPEMKELNIPVKLPEENPVKNCRVFGLDIEGRDCGDDVARWLTAFLKSEPYRLVHFETQMAPRKCSEIKIPFRTTDKVPYNDAGPLLVISESSMEDLSTRMETKVDMRNFRPSITVSGCSAYEEDTWDKVVIGDVEMKHVMACGRCILTTVDPDTGIIDRKEPLETLKSYRMCDPAQKHIHKSAPLFGSYYGIDKVGTIKKGDPVYKIIEC